MVNEEAVMALLSCVEAYTRNNYGEITDEDITTGRAEQIFSEALLNCNNILSQYDYYEQDEIINAAKEFWGSSKSEMSFVRNLMNKSPNDGYKWIKLFGYVFVGGVALYAIFAWLKDMKGLK